MMDRLTLMLMRLLARLPLGLHAWLGRLIGALLWHANRERRQTTRTNLHLCFPELPKAEREVIARRHFAHFAESVLARALLWHAPAERLKQLIRLEGLEHLQALQGRPAILLAPHFVGLDMGWTRLTLERDMVTMYAKVKQPALDAALLAGRRRFGDQVLLSRQEGLRPAIAGIRAGRPFYYLPDMDYGPRDAVFVPFCGVPCATLTALSRLAKLTGAAVLPVITRRTGDGYLTRIGPTWMDFPGADAEADARRMNQYIEAEIRSGDIAQYFWSHKRFKTRPPGEKGVY
jgi:KDO2-lipid IV(A) lauroyltransferase